MTAELTAALERQYDRCSELRNQLRLRERYESGQGIKAPVPKLAARHLRELLRLAEAEGLKIRAKRDESEAKQARKPDAEQECHRLVSEFFKGDEARAAMWFRIPNPLFGMSPMDLAAVKGWPRLLKYVRQQLAENKPEPKRRKEPDVEVKR